MVGHYPVAFEEHLLGHLAEDDVEDESGCGKDGGTVQYVAESAGKVLVGGRIGRCHVDGAFEAVGFEDVFDGSDEVVHADPAHVLAAVAEDAAGAHLKWEEHLVECTAFGV